MGSVDEVLVCVQKELLDCGVDSLMTAAVGAVGEGVAAAGRIAQGTLRKENVAAPGGSFGGEMMTKRHLLGSDSGDAFVAAVADVVVVASTDADCLSTIVGEPLARYERHFQYLMAEVKTHHWYEY